MEIREIQGENVLQKGDLNDDRKLDEADVNIMVRYIMGLSYTMFANAYALKGFRFTNK